QRDAPEGFDDGVGEPLPFVDLAEEAERLDVAQIRRIPASDGPLGARYESLGVVVVRDAFEHRERHTPMSEQARPERGMQRRAATPLVAAGVLDEVAE